MNIATVERVGHWLIPVTFITIGTVILIESGVTADSCSRGPLHRPW